MKVLQLCHKPPLPTVDGGCIAMNAITQGLLYLGHEVKVLAISTNKHPFNKKKLSPGYVKKTGIESVRINTSITVTGALTALILNRSYHLSRFKSNVFAQKLQNELKSQSYDIIHLESIFVTPYLEIIRKNSSAKVILRAHNIEHEIWEKLSGENSNYIKKCYLRVLSRQLRKYEINIFKRVDGIAAISTEDSHKIRFLGSNCFLEVIPPGIAIEKYPDVPALSGQPVKIFHLGAMDWQPNLEGIRWFLKMVWPRVIEKHPLAELHLAGRMMPESLYQHQGKQVYVYGEVDDAMEFMSSKNVMIVPLLSGSGIRMKIIEAFAMKKPVITTVQGASGMEVENEKNLLIAENADEMADHINRLIADPEFARKIGENGRVIAERFYGLQNNSGKLVSFYKKLLK